MTDAVNLQVSKHDYLLILGALRESASVIPDQELRTRLGTTEAELTALRWRVLAQGEEQGASE